MLLIKGKNNAAISTKKDSERPDRKYWPEIGGPKVDSSHPGTHFLQSNS